MLQTFLLNVPNALRHTLCVLFCLKVESIFTLSNNLTTVTKLSNVYTQLTTNTEGRINVEIKGFGV